MSPESTPGRRSTWPAVRPWPRPSGGPPIAGGSTATTEASATRRGLDPREGIALDAADASGTLVPGPAAQTTRGPGGQDAPMIGSCERTGGPTVPHPSHEQPPLTILLISSELPPETGFGGIGTYVATLAPALAELGHRVIVLSRTLGREDRVERHGNVDVIRLADQLPPDGFWQAPFTPSEVTTAHSHYARAYTVATALREIPLLRDVDIIEAPDWAGEAALASLALPEIPHVIRFHTPAQLVFAWNDTMTDDGFVQALHRLEAWAVQNAWGFTCPSRWMVTACEDLFAIPPGRISVIPNPLDLGAFPAPAPSRTRGRDVLYVGRLETRKGVLDVLPAVIRVLEALPDVRFRLVGADTCSAPGGRSVRETITAAVPPRLRPRVELLGAQPREALPALLADAGVVLLPSRRENFPYTCLEAMACAAPVVGSRAGGMAEAIEDGRTGLLVDPSSTDETMDALFRLLLQPELAGRLGMRARETVLARYAPPSIARQVEAHYRSVMESTRPRWRS